MKKMRILMKGYQKRLRMKMVRMKMVKVYIHKMMKVNKMIVKIKVKIC